MSSMNFGKHADGTLSSCRAKPENRGKGNCHHVEHLELPLELLKTGYLQKYNQNVIEESYRAAGITDIPLIISRKHKAIEPPPVADFSIEELHAASDAVAEKILDQDFKMIQDFYKLYEREMNDEELIYSLDGNLQDVADYIDSEDPTAVKLRAYIGAEVDTDDLTEILYKGVGAMTNAYEWSANGRNSVLRSILSTLRNDMRKENYVSSVLFFKGRCCYCDRPLSKSGGPATTPSGEHITPVKPEKDDEIIGGTRYGNMALACKKCNGDRGNKELVSWINSTRVIKREEKVKALGRIKAFREFANYSDYTREESDGIRAAADRIQVEVEKLRDETGKLPRGQGNEIRKLIADVVVEFSNGKSYPVEFTKYYPK
jgi:hypothetical protein